MGTFLIIVGCIVALAIIVAIAAAASNGKKKYEQ